MNAFKIIIINENISIPIIVVEKEGEKFLRNKTILRDFSFSIDQTLESLGLEKISYKNLLPGYKKIKLGDPLIGQTCAICCCEYANLEYKRTLNCNHTFHKKCIDKWLKKNPSCPNCRSDLF